MKDLNQTTTTKPKHPKPKENSTNTKPPSSSSSSSWGSHIVRGLKPKPLNTNNNLTNMPNISHNTKPKRGLITDLSCTQVHPHNNINVNSKSQSRNLVLEIENLRGLLKEYKDREVRLQAELSETKTEAKRVVERVGVLEKEKEGLKKELVVGNKGKKNNEDVEMEVVELRRVNMELQLQKRDLSCRVDSLEKQLVGVGAFNNHGSSPESEVVRKIKAEASMLRHTNEDLSKQVEGLQMNRLSEVEELAYLRWINAQLRNELRNSCSCTTSESEVGPSPYSTDTKATIGVGVSCANDELIECNSSTRLSVAKKLNKWPVPDEDVASLGSSGRSVCDKRWEELSEGSISGRRHSMSGSKNADDDLMFSKRRQSDGFMFSKEIEFKEEDQLSSLKHEMSKLLVPTDVEKRALRVPTPPPRPSFEVSPGPSEPGSAQSSRTPPPPPPPPPPPKLSAGKSSTVVQRAPQVVEFYHSLMKRDTRRDSNCGVICETANVAGVKSSMIDEIQNRSSYLLAIKADVETQGEFVNSLIREVNNAVYRDIEDVVAFVKWLDDELCFLVDERAVLKHFDWPEKKADILREAAFGYKDLKKLESEVTRYHDDPRLPCDAALKKMVSLSEKIERTVYNLLRTRDSLMRSCKEFRIPTDWMLDNDLISKVKIASVKLAKKYMNRVATELQCRSSIEKDPAMDYMLLQGVRFAFRIHQFAGGFDAETMHAFEELRRLAHVFNER